MLLKFLLYNAETGLLEKENATKFKIRIELLSKGRNLKCVILIELTVGNNVTTIAIGA